MLYILTPVFCAGLCLGTVFSFFNRDNKVTANAVMSTTSSNAEVIGELAKDYKANGWKGLYNTANVSKLYGAISGTTGVDATLQSVKDALTSSSSTELVTGNKVITATDLAAVSTHSGKDIVVSFGGFEWTVVYVSESTGGDVVATLLLADSLKDDNGSAVPACWMDWADSNAPSTTEYDYPANMYSTSQLRSTLMGTKYSTDGSTLSTAVQGEAKQHSGLKAMANNFGSTGVIATPGDMKWQEAETSKDVLTAANYKLTNVPPHVRQFNDAWGTGFNDYCSYLSGSSNNYEYKPTYTEWKNDYFWVPSVAERVYFSDAVQGMWKLTANQRTCTGIKYSSNGQPFFWYRTAAAANVTNPAWWTSGAVAFNTTNNGEYLYCGGDCLSSIAVRPAMHLNLSELNKKALNNPVDVTTEPDGNSGRKDIVYDGSVKDLDAVLPDWYEGNESFYSDYADITYHYKNTGDTTAFDTTAPGTLTAATDVKDAGKYQVTIELKSNSPFTWYDASGNPVTEKKFTLTVKQCEVKYKWANTGLDTSWKTTFAQTFAPATGTSAAPWVYLNYTLPDSTDNAASGGSGGTTSNDKVPYVQLTFTGTQSQFADYKISDIDNVRSTTSKGTDYPKHADTYTVSFTDKNAKTSNYKLVADTGESSTRQYIIERLKVDVPTAPNALTYNGANQSFANVPKFDSKFMTYGQMATDGTTYQENATPDDMTASVNAGTGKLTLTGKDAGKYDMYYRLLTAANTSGVQVVRDYMWTDASAADPAPVRKVTYEIKPKVLEFTFSSSSIGWSIKNDDETNKLTYNYASGKGPVAAEEPVLELYYYLNSDGETNAVKHSDSAELLFKDLTDKNGKHSTGKYTVVIRLADWDDTNTVNKNYVIDDAAAATYKKEVTLTAGEASLDDVTFVYTDSTMGEGEEPKEIPSGGLKYVYDTTAKSAVEYQLLLDLSALPNLETVGAYTYSYADGSSTVNKAGEVTVTVSIQVKEDERSSTKLPATYTGTKFTYSRINDHTGTITFKLNISKATMSLTESDIPLQYKVSGGSWTAYDSKNSPQFNGEAIDIRVNPDTDLWPDGVKNISLSPNTEMSGTVVRRYNLMAAITVDDNYETVAALPVSWEISAEEIALDWQDKCITVNDVDFWVPELNVSANQAQYFKYEYYYAEGPDKDKKIGNLEDLCTADRVTSPINLYVKVVQSGGENQFKLADDPENNHTKPFTLGENKTLVNVTTDIPEIKYGDDKAVSVSLKNSLTGNALNESLYELNIYRGTDKTNLANNVALGSLKDFDVSKADAGAYIIEIKLLPDADGNLRYALDRSRLITFEIAKKEIAVPTVGNILFSGEYINLADYLGGSYAEYKDIIALGGDYQDLRNVSQSGYKARLTLTDHNYKWATPTTAEPAGLKLFAAKLFDNALEVLDDVTAELKWNITPLVIDVSEMWNKSGKSGATLNLPENITKLITGETLSVGYKYYDDADQYLETPELKGGKSFRVEAVFGGIDAESGNVLFKNADGNFGTVSDKISYTVPQSGFAIAMGSVLNFLKANWLWLVIAVVALILLIIIIACAVRASKKKRKREEERLAREEQRRLEEKEERERKEEERRQREDERRREEREERMAARMAMPQMMPQMPQMMGGQMPMQQSMPAAQPMA
ncbi:MAG: hypothetical protein K2J61_06210, partial [Clostridia bacterium]|nr:hypothetical protein [Clostridia bacterium]